MRIRTAVSLLTFTALGLGTHAATFVTEGNAIRKGVPAMHGETPVMYLGELNGSVSCYTLDGKKLWRNVTKTPAVQFEIAAIDVDNDGNDDLVTASGDGSITCWKSDGSLKWKFTSVT